jgi:endonuclease-3
VREATEAKKKRAKKILAHLDRAYPDAKCALVFDTPFELLVATILSAQCTDERVNAVTKDLFRRYRTPGDYARASLPALENEIRSTGFYRAKAKSLVGMAKALVERHGGEVPRDREALQALPGVGLKTANVVLGNAFREPAIAVDTHVSRISHRLGFAKAEDPDDIHDQLTRILPRPGWTHACHVIQAHGRRTCTARKPACPTCPVRALCPWPEKTRG